MSAALAAAALLRPFPALVCTALAAGCSQSPERALVPGQSVTDAAAVKATSPECRDPVDHVALRACAILERDRADLRLSEQMRTTLQRLKQVNAIDLDIAKSRGSVSKGYRDEQERYVTSLVRSQQAWTTYRKEFCNVARFPGRGGNSNEENMIDCELPLIELRIKQLKTLTAELEPDG
ncbi:MAG: DUF1311 domain-containing protein [Novosphingobium sp.]|nr:DUF1311 domain-containing protein [Novosphingobium sp.]